ncbi:roadblock/LC7 domain-containing protein [Streptomyces niveiscabiei]|uniref:roadblock/LC7 domain-containing protein n=1 Tax=Streptomyces niveiscabiei TaxID=164115 RepID=UPI0029B7EDD9|nr:roadblock/LC7 domain-containing protein [Streptomyces niveiscabiei]MDX3387053.1 roadblock/LC7 domain-containing protein [Streptomyces niveiscabiei]
MDAHEAGILDELRRLRASVPQLTGALAASVDGLVLAADTPGVEPEGVAALTAAALGVAVRLTDETGQGELRELLVRGVYGYVATYAAGESAVLTLLAQDRVNVGRLHLEGRRTGARIGELTDAAAKENAAARTRAAKKTSAKRTSTPGAAESTPLPELPPLPPLPARPARTPTDDTRATTES